MSRAKLYEAIDLAWNLVCLAVCLWVVWAWLPALGEAWQNVRDSFPVQIHVTIVPGGR